MKRTLTATLLALLPAVAAAQGAAPKLSIGDPAPPLAIGEWIKGEPVTALGNGRVTVMDFWATWCGPCIQAIPHMSELQAKYADQKVDVIGVSIWERDPSAVTPFVKQRDENDKQGDEMAYRVAMDAVPPLPEGVKEGSREAAENAGKGKMALSWMGAAGRNGIPTVFIVDREGRVAWIGHPMNGMDEALAKIVDGSFDLDAAREAEAREQAAMLVAGKYGEKLDKGDLAGAQELIRSELGGPLWERPDLLNFVAWTLVDPESKLEGERDLDLALKVAERANELTEGQDASTLDTLARVHFTRGDVDRAVELQRSAVAKAPLTQKGALEKILEEYEAAGQKGGTR